MEDFLIVGMSHLDTPIYMSELSTSTLRDNGIEGKIGGLYLYEADDGPSSTGIRVLASLPNADAAYRLIDLIGVRVPASRA